jgi:hypothetical protein
VARGDRVGLELGMALTRLPRLVVANDRNALLEALDELGDRFGRGHVVEAMAWELGYLTELIIRSSGVPIEVGLAGLEDAAKRGLEVIAELRTMTEEPPDGR